VPDGCEARALRTTAPVSISQTTTLTDWVDESTPATSVMRSLLAKAFVEISALVSALFHG
jgi:hypothetical protein